MAKVVLAIFLSCLNLIAGQFLSSHDYLMEQFRKTSTPSSIASVQKKWITQPIDHLNQSDQRTWQMKYLENMKKWCEGGPIFIYIGGQGVISSNFLGSGLVYDLAKETNGAMFATEHRYYGIKGPFKKITVTNLKYLSSVQALADIANLIKQLKQTTPFSSSKVVVVGGAYAGNLAAWMRIRYPDLVDAAVSSSASVLAKLEFVEYLDQVGKDYQKYATPDCFSQITDRFNELKDLIKSSSGIEKIKEKFNICKQSDLTKPENQAFFFFIQLLPYMFKAEYGSVDIIRNDCTKSKQVDVPCNILDFNLYYNPKTLNPWLYQLCTEFGYNFIAPENLPFAGIPVDVDFYVKMCTSTFGPEYDKASIEAAIKKTNDMYGGLNPNVTNVIFVNGDIDPWHRLGVLKDLAETVPARVIPEASHCNDLLSIDNEAVKKVQAEEKMFIKKWIGLST